jgi:hypothetical protein
MTNADEQKHTMRDITYTFVLLSRIFVSSYHLSVKNILSDYNWRFSSVWLILYFRGTKEITQNIHRQSKLCFFSEIEI